MIKKYFLISILTLVYSTVLVAQSSQEPFGKNRIQYKNFGWKLIATTNFEVYFYGAEDLAVKVAKYAEEDYSRIVDMTGYQPSEKIKIVLFHSVDDMQQSNIGLSDQEIMIGGQTVLVKTRIEVAFKGTQIELMNDISMGIAYTIINTVMYGGNVKDVVKSSYLLSLPDWFINGAATYIAKDWSQDMDNFMRDKIIHYKLRNPTNYKGEEATYIGQSIWNYIAKEYGKGDMVNIISLTRAFRNERQSIESNLGMSFDEFIAKWMLYYENMQVPVKASYQAWSDTSSLLKARKNAKIYSVSISPDGAKVAYVQNFKGKYKLRVADVATKRVKTICRGGYKRVDQAVDMYSPILAWQNEKALSYMVHRRDQLMLYNLDFTSGKKMSKKIKDFRNVYSLSYSKDGNQLVLSADRLGQTDIYTLAGGNVVQITDDAFDDLYPVFDANNRIFFSSNRTSDTLRVSKELPSYATPYSLYMYSPTNKNMLKKLSVPGNTTFAQIGQDGRLFFVSDKTGIQNVYEYNFKDNQLLQLTAQPTSIEAFSIAKTTNIAAVSKLQRGREYIYLKNIGLDKPIAATPITARRSLLETFVDPNEKVLPDDSVNFNFNSEEKSVEKNEFEELTFESEVKDATDSLKKKEAPYVPPVNPFRYAGPMKYRNPFSVDKVVSTLMIDQLRGLGALLEGGMSDLVGNHRIDAGGFVAFDFRSNKLYGEYRYVKRRTDLKFRFDRQTLNPFNNNASHRYIMNVIGVTTSYPLSVYHRISLTPFITTTNFRETTAQTTIARPDITAFYKSLRGEYVYDNTLVTGMNMLKGTRFKLSTEYYVGNSSGKQDFGLMFLDFRKYIPIHRELVFATRVSYGHYFGNAPKNFILGGMDNWLLSNREFYSSTNSPTNDPLTIDQGVDNSDLLFVRYVTSVRGFQYNTQAGPKYLLFNAEIRLPIAQYFYRGTISSNFLRNLQFIGFTDIGAAYRGLSPFTTDNTQNKQTIPGNPFSASVTNYRSPFLIGYGAGVRTMLLGYYVKVDLGWGLQNKVMSRPQLYLTFGYDF